MSNLMVGGILIVFFILGLYFEISIYRHYKQLKILEIWVSQTLDAYLSEEEKEIAGNALAKIIAMDNSKLSLVKQWHNRMFIDKS